VRKSAFLQVAVAMAPVFSEKYPGSGSSLQMMQLQVLCLLQDPRRMARRKLHIFENIELPAKLQTISY